MTLKKMGKRTVRESCPKHGTDAHYWVQDELGRWGWVDATPTTRSRPHGADVTRHGLSECQPAPKAGKTYIPTDASASSDAAPAATKFIPTPVTEIPPMPNAKTETEDTPTVTAKTADNPQAAALAALLATLSPSVDPESVRKIVKDELQSVVFPTTTVVVREHDDVKVEIEGAHPALAKVISALSVGEHVMMVGPAGTGKTHIAAQAAEALGRKFSSLSVSPQTSKAEITGYCDANGNYVPNGQFRGAYEGGGLHLFDEIDRGHAGVLTIMNAALANGAMSFPDRMVKKGAGFLCCAAANTYGRGPDRKFVGAQALDDATLDRFTVITVDYDLALEDALCRATGLESAKTAQVLKYVRHLRQNAAQHVMPVTVGMRASVGACRLLTGGFTWNEAVNARMRRGLSDADWSKLSASAPAVTL